MTPTPAIPATPANPEAPAGPAPAAAMGRAAFRGSFWMMFNALATRFASLGAQVLLGKWLAQADFGVYGVAMSMSALAGVLRDGGVRPYLVKEHARHEELVGPVFYIAMTFNTLTALVLAGLAQVSSFWTDDPQKAHDVRNVLYVIAACQILNTPGAMLQAKLMGRMQFGIVSMLTGISAMIRFGGAVLLAGLFGEKLGALSFVLPLPVCALFEWAGFWWYNREKLWTRSPRLEMWAGMLTKTSWILLGSFAIAMINWGNNPALSGASKDLDLVAIYFFAYNIVAQVGILLSANVGQVLVPAFTRLVHEPERLRAGVLRAVRQIMLLAGPLSLGLAVTFPPLEKLLWHGRWERSADAVRVMGMLYPLTVSLAVPLSLQQAMGRFRAWALGMILVGVLTVGAALGVGLWYHAQVGTLPAEATFGDDPAGLAAAQAALATRTVWATRVALAAGVLGSLAALGYAAVILRDAGAKRRQTIGSALPAWLLSLIAAAPVMWLDSHTFLPWPALPRFLVTGTIFVALFALLARVVIPSHLRELMATMPARVRPFLARALLLSEPGA